MDLERSFLNEANELLERISEDVLIFESDPKNEEYINRIYRAAHTLKGSANLYGYSGIATITHFLESLLDDIREGLSQMQPSLADLLLDSFDQVKVLVDRLANGMEDPQSDPEIIRRLSQWLDKDNLPKKDSDPSSVSLLFEDTHRWKDIVYQAMEGKAALDLSSYFTRADVASFREYETDSILDDTFSQLEKVIVGVIRTQKPGKQTLIKMRDSIQKMEEIIDSLPMIDGVKQVFSHLFTSLLILEFHLVRLIGNGEPKPTWWKELWTSWLDLLRELKSGQIPEGSYDLALDIWELCQTDAIGEETQEEEEQEVFGTLLSPPTLEEEEINDLFRSDQEEKQEAFVSLLSPPTTEEKEQSNLGQCSEVAASMAVASISRISAESTQPSQKMAEKLLVEQIYYLAPKGRPIIERWSLARRIMNQCALVLNDSELLYLTEQDAPDISQLKLRVKEYPNPSNLTEKPDYTVSDDGEMTEQDFKGRKKESRAEQGETERILRIEQGKIDHLMELIGELTIAKNAFPYMIRKLSQEHHLPGLARELKEKYAMIDRISKELQDTIVDVRMLPLSSVFSKFNRFARDLARQSKKKIHLEISGEETTLDKTLVETLSEPLIHLVRNAIDHGLESVEERIQKGKTAEGLLQLHAWREGNRVYIEVTDDGRGINSALIRRKIQQLDLASDDQMEQMKEEDLLNYIFHPGFSTAEEITSLSGRGIGMDAVQNNIRQMQGNVQVFSRPDQGTTVRLELPLSLTMTHILQIIVDGHLYGIPLDQVQETVKVDHQDIQMMQGQRMIVLRDRLFPIVSLKHYLGYSVELDSPRDSRSIYLVILKDGVSLEVDSFVGQQEVVIKPLDQSLRHLNYLSGASISGDGTIILILNGKVINI